MAVYYPAVFHGEPQHAGPLTLEEAGPGFDTAAQAWQWLADAWVATLDEQPAPLDVTSAQHEFLDRDEPGSLWQPTDGDGDEDAGRTYVVSEAN